MAAGAMANQNATTKHYLKGQKMKMDMGNTAVVIDLDAQTFTNINNNDKTYTVTKFADLAKNVKDIGADIQVDVKETGQRKKINGFDASQVVMTMTMEGMQPGRASGMKMLMEMEMWLSADVPGASEAKAFFQKNADKLPWAAMGGGNPQMQKSMAAMQKKIATLGGVTVLQIVRTKMGGGDPQMQEAMARMQAMRGGAPGGALFEMTMESSDFSTAGIPESVFAIPAGYTKK
jgi:hypothetical protein